jgi:hypothetical protein
LRTALPSILSAPRSPNSSPTCAPRTVMCGKPVHTLAHSALAPLEAVRIRLVSDRKYATGFLPALVKMVCCCRSRPIRALTRVPGEGGRTPRILYDGCSYATTCPHRAQTPASRRCSPSRSRMPSGRCALLPCWHDPSRQDTHSSPLMVHPG